MTKILLLESSYADFGVTQIYMGLCQVLGDENIIEYPYKYALHQQDNQYPVPKVDIDRFMRDNPKANFINLFPQCAPWPWIIPSSNREYRYEEILDKIKKNEFDFIILPPRELSIYNLEKLISDYGCGSGSGSGSGDGFPPVILCDFEDALVPRYDLYQKFKPHVKVMTKSSYVPGVSFQFDNFADDKIKVYSLSLSSPIPCNPKYKFDDSDEHKTINIYARFGFTRVLRRYVIDDIKDMKGYVGACVGGWAQDGINLTGEGSYVQYHEYCREIASSKIAVSMRGHGNLGNPNKIWEIPSYNTFMLTEPNSTAYEYPFEDMKTCAMFDPTIRGDVRNKALYWLRDENENERRKIAKAGNSWLLEHHTVQKRAERLLDIARIENVI